MIDPHLDKDMDHLGGQLEAIRDLLFMLLEKQGLTSEYLWERFEHQRQLAIDTLVHRHASRTDETN